MIEIICDEEKEKEEHITTKKRSGVHSFFYSRIPCSKKTRKYKNPKMNTHDEKEKGNNSNEKKKINIMYLSFHQIDE